MFRQCRFVHAVFVVMLFSPLRSQGLPLMTYNVKGNGAASWPTNSSQVQAIGRTVRHLNPDIITFNEIPQDYIYEMTNFVAAFLPGYSLAANSVGDGYIRNVIVSRYPILSSASYLHGSSLSSFGYSGTFTRDLFKAEISVPNFDKPIGVFTTHLKATTSNPPSDAARRAAEAASISNFFARYYLATNGGRLYTLSGDMNEDVIRPDSSYTTGFPIQTLVSAPTGLRLTTPVNPLSQPPANDLTISIQKSLNVRFDYILPCATLYSNIIGSQIFRTDLLNPTPSGLLKFDDKTASDHLPVIMVFNNPYDVPFKFLSAGVANSLLTLKWESSAGRKYRLDASSDLTNWMPLATNLPATGNTFTFTTNVPNGSLYFRVYRVP